MNLCDFCGSQNRVSYSSKYDGYLCHKHYMQAYHGKKLRNRFRNSPNEIVVFDDHAEIVLYDISQNERDERCEIDLQDVEKCRNRKWHLHIKGYVAANIDGEEVFIHNFIMDNYSEEFVVDHKNRNRLDNKRSNLRIATYSQNNMNSELRGNNSSGVTGVSFHKKRNQWEAYLRKGGVRVFHKWCNDFEESVKARKEAEIIYFGEYRYA